MTAQIELFNQAPAPHRARPFRIGDDQRHRTGVLLGQALRAGYLTLDEYETRLDAVHRSQTMSALDELLGDLPVAELQRNDPLRLAARTAHARLAVRIHFFVYLAVTVLLFGIWLVIAIAAGAWYPWPIWPALGGGLGVLSHAIPVSMLTQQSASRG